MFWPNSATLSATLDGYVSLSARLEVWRVVAPVEDRPGLIVEAVHRPYFVRRQHGQDRHLPAGINRVVIFNHGAHLKTLACLLFMPKQKVNGGNKPRNDDNNCLMVPSV